MKLIEERRKLPPPLRSFFTISAGTLIIITYIMFFFFFVHESLISIWSLFPADLFWMYPKKTNKRSRGFCFWWSSAYWWYYEDNAVENDPTLKSLSLKEFTSLCILFLICFELNFKVGWSGPLTCELLVFNSCDVLRPYVSNIDDIFKDYACAMREVSFGFVCFIVSFAWFICFGYFYISLDISYKRHLLS